MHRIKFFIKKTKAALVLGAVFLVYLLQIPFTGFRVPCIFHRITGLRCPGCGSTRFALAVLKFDFASAYSYNQFLFLTWPFLFFEAVYTLFLYPAEIFKGSAKFRKINDKLLIIYLVALVAFGILRNLLSF